MSRLDDDTLGVVVSWIPAADLLPTALTCTRFRDMCTARAKLEPRTMYDPVTRTHKAVRWKTRAASSVNRAKWAIAMGATPEEEWCTAAASQGDLGLLQWVRLVGAPWNGGAYKDAAAAGHLHVLKFLWEHHCPFENEGEGLDAQDGLDVALYVSCVSGQLVASQWLYECGAKADAMITAAAADAGHIALLEWLLSVDAEFTTAATTEACESGELDALRWLHAHGVPWDESAFHAAAANGFTELLRFMHAKGAEWGESIAAAAAKSGHLDTLKYLRDTNASLDTSIAAAAKNGHMHILRWLLENGVKSHHSRRPNSWSSIEGFELLHSHGVPLDEYCVFAAFYGEMEMLRRLHEHAVPLHPCAVVLATREGHLDVLDWLRAHGAPEPTQNDVQFGLNLTGNYGRCEWLDLVSGLLCRRCNLKKNRRGEEKT